MLNKPIFLLIGLAGLAVTSLPAQTAIQVVYGDNPQEELDAGRVVQIRNAYEESIADLETERRRREAALIDKANKERQVLLETERRRMAAALAEKQALLDEKQTRLDVLEAERREAQRKVAEQQRISSEYQMAVDHTVKVINHQGDMPEYLPPVATEGHDAPLVAVFNSVVPIDWQVYVHQDVGQDLPVSWFSDNDNWVGVLYQVGVRNDLAFDIHWNDRWVLVNRSDLRLGMSGSGNPTIEVMGHRVAPGTEGHILIDGKIIRVRSTDR